MYVCMSIVHDIYKNEKKEKDKLTLYRENN